MGREEGPTAPRPQKSTTESGGVHLVALKPGRQKSENPFRQLDEARRKLVLIFLELKLELRAKNGLEFDSG